MSNQKLTEKRIEALPHRAKAYTVRDAAVTGFFVDVGLSGKSYKVQAERWTGERGKRAYAGTIRMTIGRVGEMPLDSARARAAELIARIKLGEDPRPKATSAVATPSLWTVAEAYAEYVADLRKAGGAVRTGADMLYRLDRYVPDWKPLPISAVDGLMTRAAHERITRDHGPRAANQTIAEFGRVFRLAARTFGARNLPDLPTAAVRRNEEKPKKRSLADVRKWWQRVADLPNPLRRAMHQLGLLSGLRPGNLCAIRLEWIDLERPCIRFPAEVMKMRRPFEVPLSPAMFAVVESTMALARVLEPTTEWLFPTRTLTGAVVHTTTWHDRALGKESGHTLRHAYSNLAKDADLADSDIMMLMGHKVPGIRDVYTSEKDQFPRLLRLQVQVSEHILGRVAQ